MPRRRSAADWQELIAAFDSGSETIAEFCEARSLSPGYFSKRRALLRKRNSAFALGRAPLTASSPVTLTLDGVSIRCDSGVPAPWLAELVTALRS